MIAIPLALGGILVCLGMLTGVRGFTRLALLRLRQPALPLIACIVQVPNVLAQEKQTGWLVLSVALLGSFCWSNRHLPGMWLIIVGWALNAAVMAVNGGAMPVAPAALSQVYGAAVEQNAPIFWWKSQIMHDNGASLFWLGDRLVVPGLAAWSVGDVCLLVGVGRLLHATMTRETGYDPASI